MIKKATFTGNAFKLEMEDGETYFLSSLKGNYGLQLLKNVVEMQEPYGLAIDLEEVEDLNEEIGEYIAKCLNKCSIKTISRDEN